MELRFTSPGEHPPGTVYRLLKRAWAQLWNPKLAEKIGRFDRDIAQYPDTVGACTFVTCLGDEPIGMASCNPRQAPDPALIGWNCIVPEYQQRGYGKAQILEVLRILRGRGIRTVRVTTTDEGFFIPAMRTYESCGFIVRRMTADNNIEYELALDGGPDGPAAGTEAHETN